MFKQLEKKLKIIIPMERDNGQKCPHKLMVCRPGFTFQLEGSYALTKNLTLQAGVEEYPGEGITDIMLQSFSAPGSEMSLWARSGTGFNNVFHFIFKRCESYLAFTSLYFPHV
jgi:hypothetical protein